MSKSTEYWIKANFNSDKTTHQIVKEVNKLDRRWKKKFNLLSLYLPARLIFKLEKHSTNEVIKALNKKGFKVKFRKTKDLRNLLSAVKAENKSLILSLQSHYFSRIKSILYEAIVKDSTASSLAEKLSHQLGVTERQAKRAIEYQVNNAATSISSRIAINAGFYEAEWIHSHKDKKPRPLHLKADGTIFDLRKGLPIGDKGENVLPATIYGCTCSFKIIIE